MGKSCLEKFKGQVEIIDLRTLNPLDWEAVKASVEKHGRALVLTEEPLMNSFAESLAGRLNQHCFEHLDAPVKSYGALNLPAIGLNVEWEKPCCLVLRRWRKRLGICWGIRPPSPPAGRKTHGI